MANSIIDDTTAIGKRLREITGETTKAKVVKIDCIHCRDVGWVRSGPSSRWRECVACGSWKHHPRPDYWK